MLIFNAREHFGHMDASILVSTLPPRPDRITLAQPFFEVDQVVPVIIYDFKGIGGALRKQRIDDWWQPAKPEPEPKAAEPEMHDWLLDPFGGWVGGY